MWVIRAWKYTLFQISSYTLHCKITCSSFSLTFLLHIRQSMSSSSTFLYLLLQAKHNTYIRLRHVCLQNLCCVMVHFQPDTLSIVFQCYLIETCIHENPWTTCIQYLKVGDACIRFPCIIFKIPLWCIFKPALIHTLHLKLGNFNNKGLIELVIIINSLPECGMLDKVYKRILRFKGLHRGL